MKKIALLLAVTGSLFASTEIKSIDIFTNKTFVNQKINLASKSVDLIGQVRLEDVRFLLKEGCKVNSSDIEHVNFENDDLSIKIEELKGKINAKHNEIKALQSNISFLEKTSITNIANSNSLKNTSEFLKKEILANHNSIFALQKYIKEDNEELKQLIKKRANSKFTKLDFDVSCNSDVLISYPIYNLSRNGFYEINYDSKDKKIDIKNSSFLTQSSGVDFKNIDINLYTYNFSNQLKPNKFYPKYLDVYNPKSVAYAQEEVMMMDAAMPMKKMARLKAAPRPTFAYVEDTTKSFFKASNITLLSGKKTEVTFAKDEYKANDSLEIDGYSSAQAFYKVDFISKKLYGVLNAKLFLDGTYIGRNSLKEIQKDKESEIHFGTNRFIDVKKELVKDMKEEPFFSMNKLKTQKIWEYKITNNSSKIQSLTLLERVPVSKHEDIKVKLIGKSKENKFDKNGKIYFDLKLKPNESKIINFGYEIERPNKNK